MFPDHYEDEICWPETQFPVARGNKKAEPTWVTQDGRRLRYSELTNEHLVNILRMLKQRAIESFASIIKLPELSGDGATLANDVEGMIEEGWYSCVHSKFDSLVKEAEKRGLRWEMNVDEAFMKLVGIGRGSLERSIVGALKDTIRQHGPIDQHNAPSAGKRIIGVLKTLTKKNSNEKKEAIDGDA